MTKKTKSQPLAGGSYMKNKDTGELTPNKPKPQSKKTG